MRSIRVCSLISFLVVLGLSTSSHAGTVALAWNASQGATSYKLYYGLASGSYQTVVETGAATTASVSGLSDGTRYYFAATASNEAGESGYSNEVSAVPGAQAVMAVNAGGPQFTAGDGTVYDADRWFSGGRTFSTSASIDGTTDDTLYRSERYGNFTYNIAVANGSYLVTLKFAEIYHNKAGRRIFDVLAEGVEVISNLDIYAAAGGKNRAYDRTMTVQVSDSVLTLQFRRDRDQAKVSAIKVVPQ